MLGMVEGLLFPPGFAPLFPVEELPAPVEPPPQAIKRSPNVGVSKQASTDRTGCPSPVLTRVDKLREGQFKLIASV